MVFPVQVYPFGMKGIIVWNYVLPIPEKGKRATHYKI